MRHGRTDVALCRRLVRRRASRAANAASALPLVVVSTIATSIALFPAHASGIASTSGTAHASDAASATGSVSTARASHSPESRVTGRVEIGYDAFEERYSIVDTDTLDRVNEWRTRLQLGWSHGRFLANYFRTEGRILFGQDDTEMAVRIRASRLLRAGYHSRISLDAEGMRRAFGTDSDLSFPNNYNRLLANASARLGVSRRVALRATHRLESLDYAQRTEFDYDYLRNQSALSVEYSPSLATSIIGGARVVSMSIPDSSRIEYTGLIPFVEFRSTPSPEGSFRGGLTAERRLYKPGATRASFWNVSGSAGIARTVAGPVGVVFEDESDWYDYDGGTGAYFDSFENRAVLLARYTSAMRLRIGAGGAWGVFRSGQSPDDEYNEYGGIVRMNLTPRASTWLDLEYELGHRRYLAFDPAAAFEAASVFSSYNYHRVSLLGAWRFFDGLSLNVFVDYQPEDHEREGDDATATLFSANVSWTF